MDFRLRQKSYLVFAAIFSIKFSIKLRYIYLSLPALVCICSIIFGLLLYNGINVYPLIPSSKCSAECIRHAVRVNLTAEFPSQPTKSWQTVSACLAKQVNFAKSPNSPCVLMLAASAAVHAIKSGSKNTFNRLVSRLHEVLAECECIRVAADCRDFHVPPSSPAASTDAADAAVSVPDTSVSLRRPLNDAADAAAKSAGSALPCLTVRRLDRLTGEAAFLFYSLADTTNSRQRRFFYALTVEPEDPTVSLTAELEVLELLKTAWLKTGMPSDQFDPLWARIGNNVLIVGPD